MRILTLSPHVPYAGIAHAGGAFLLRYLELLAASNEVTLMVPGSPEVARARASAPEWLDILVAEPVERRFDLRQQVDRLKASRRYRALRSSSVRALRSGGLHVRAAAADIVELHWMEMAVLAPELRAVGVRTPIVVVAHDVHAEAAPSRSLHLGRPIERIVGAGLEPLRRRAERADLNATDLVLVFKAEDERLLRDIGVSAPTQILAPDIVFPNAPVPDATGPSLLFTGAMWRPENELGVLWFLDRVWPRVRDALPEASFTIAGAGPSAALDDAARRTPGVQLTGFVQSLLPYYAEASAFVAPLFVAGGLKFKVAQAMAFELPVIATSVAAAGYVDHDGSAPMWAVTDDADDMARAVIDLCRSPEASRAVGRAAARWCRERFSFERSTEEVLATYARLAARI